jgi:outer membrane protein assembly factor BamB
LTALSIKDGSELWSFANASCDGPTRVLADQGLVYVGGHDGNLYAVESRTGKQRWTSDFISDAPPDPPGFARTVARIQNTKARPNEISSDGKVLFLSIFDQCRVVAVRADNGKRLWSFQTGGWVHGLAVATDKHVFFGSQDDCFYCVDKQTGKESWKIRTKGRIESGSVVDQKYVYFGSCDGGLYCLNQSDGKQQWRFATDSDSAGKKSAINSVPVLRRGGICFAAGEGQAYSVDCETGKLNWKIRPSEGLQMYCSSATDGSRLFFVTRAAAKEGEPSLVTVGFK